jgi:glycosyltransferase involved in cell wall biosynthesis
MRKCDVCIGIGTVYLKAFETAKKNGATAILEWGSKHIEEQLKQFGMHDDYSARTKNRELQQYDVCDYISIPAKHVKDGFLKHGIPDSKLIVNPYGVDLSQFHPTSCSNEYDLIYVGGWRYEKGCDLLTELCQRYGYKLLHVGALVNLDFPKISNMTHHEPVDQKDLVNYYAKARVFVLPSRAEGLSLVQAQAIVCGLPVVCSKETGGADLREQLADKKWIIEMEDISVESLLDAVDQGLILANAQTGIRNYAGHDFKRLSWESYGARYSENLQRIR